MQLTPREFDKLVIYTMAEIAQKRKAQRLKLNYPEAVAVISAAARYGISRLPGFNRVVSPQSPDHSFRLILIVRLRQKRFT
jgi:hypothetical protein